MLNEAAILNKLAGRFLDEVRKAGLNPYKAISMAEMITDMQFGADFLEGAARKETDA